MARKETRKDSLLRLISDIGGEGTREQINAKVPEYWELADEELEIEKGVGKPLYWHRVASVCQSLKDRDHYLENPRRGVWKISEAGKKHLSSMGHRLSPPIQMPPSQITGDLPLCKELRESQRNSENPTIFEEVLVKTFQQLGFSTNHIGGRDEPDVLIEEYKTILDAKTTKEGVIGETYVNFNALKRYKEKYGMKYIGVIAPGFSGGNIQDTAARESIILIETEAICKILQNHTIYPYEASRIIEILFASGKGIIIPKDIPPSTIDQEKLIEIVAKILSDVKLTRKTSFSSRELHTAYLWQGLNYESDEIEKALKFLSVAPFSVLQMQNDEYSLTGDIESILKKIGLLLQAFNK
ncbi:hypothetical protein CEE34_06795, partial [Candidatus Aerophobetes bacterium Ae_b3a]